MDGDRATIWVRSLVGGHNDAHPASHSASPTPDRSRGKEHYVRQRLNIQEQSTGWRRASRLDCRAAAFGAQHLSSAAEEVEYPRYTGPHWRHAAHDPCPPPL